MHTPWVPSHEVVGLTVNVRSFPPYARVSTVDQSCERQLRDLAAFAERGGFEVVAAFAETASGAKDSRRERRRVMDLAQRREINAVLVTELSRWGRSTQDLLSTLYQLAGWNVSLVAMSGMTFELGTPTVRAASRTGPSLGACQCVRVWCGVVWCGVVWCRR